MSIKYKLLVIAGISVLGIIFLGVSLFFFVRSLNTALEKSRVSLQITKTVFDRRLFLDEYLINHLDRSQQQWLSVHERLVTYVHSEAPLFFSAREKALIDGMNGLFEKNKDLFLQLVTFHDGARGQSTDAMMKSRESLLANQLMVMSESIIESAGRLTKMSQEEVAIVQRNMIYLLFVSIVILISIMGGIVYFLWKSIVVPIAGLQEGTEIIGSGNLNYAVGTTRKDEIGQLSRAFDAMTEKVRDRAIKLDAANQQLKASNQQLRASNQQLDANTQQLRAANQQLVASGNSLKEKMHQLEVFNKATVGRELKMIELKKEIELLQKKLEVSGELKSKKTYD